MTIELSASQNETGEQISIFPVEPVETDHQMDDTDYLLEKTDDLFNGPWENLMKGLKKGGLKKLLNTRRIEVKGTAREYECQRNEKRYNYDMTAINDNELVVVEVKTILELEDVEDFVERLNLFKKIFRSYKNRNIYGAIAYLNSKNKAQLLAEEQGLFIIKVTGNRTMVASIINKKDFKPKVFD